MSGTTKRIGYKAGLANATPKGPPSSVQLPLAGGSSGPDPTIMGLKDPVQELSRALVAQNKDAKLWTEVLRQWLVGHSIDIPRGVFKHALARRGRPMKIETFGIYAAWEEGQRRDPRQSWAEFAKHYDPANYKKDPRKTTGDLRQAVYSAETVYRNSWPGWEPDYPAMGEQQRVRKKKAGSLR